MRSVVRTLALATIFSALSNAAIAQAPSTDELREIASCREIPKAKDRLRCFERTTEILDQFAPIAAAETEPDGSAGDQPAAVASAAPATLDTSDGVDPIASFGAEDLVQEDSENQVRELRAVAVAISQNKRGKYVVQLDNGQVWRQLQGDRNTLRVRPDKEGEGHEVIIKKRSLGSYALRMTTAKRSILVRRIK